VAEAQRGIVFIVEIDKIARKSQGARNGAGARDIGGEGVQQALLKVLEGRQIFVPLNVTQHWNKHDFVQVDTSDILFIAAGTFSDLQVKAKERAIGFERRQKPRSPRITSRDLIEYGMLSELLGRLPVVVQLQELSESELVEVLTVPPDSILREYQALLELDSITLELDDEALRTIVRYAVGRGIGARGLRAIFEEIFHDLMFEAPERAGESLKLGADFVLERLSLLDDLVVGEDA
jgi:ATP-dependent Clp protease ATP-binding subunit ClpX